MSRFQKQFLKNTPFSFLVILFLLVFAVTLPGCQFSGGGGRRSYVSPPPGPATTPEEEVIPTDIGPPPSTTPEEEVTTPEEEVIPASIDRWYLLYRAAEDYSVTDISDTVEDFLRAAGAIVSFGTREGIGHTTQSSNITPDGYTGERVDFGAEYDEYGELHFTRTRRTASRTYTSSTKDYDVFYNLLYDAPVLGWRGVETLAEYPTGVVYWDAYSNIAYPQTGNIEDPSYLTLAYWLIVLKDAYTGNITGYNLGASASGNDPYEYRHLAGLTGTATYEGPATGLYMMRDNVAAAAEFDYFNAKATLTAEFGDAGMPGTIYGTITEGMTDGGMYLPEVSLGSAEITERFHGGNFRGDTSGVTVGGVPLSGKWGGKFFGNGACTTGIPAYCALPLSVAGTFGARSEDDLQGILGAFGAEFISATTPVLTGRDILLSAIAEHPEDVGDNAATRILRAARSSVTFETREGIGHTTQSSFSLDGQTYDKMGFTAEYDESGDLHFTAMRSFIDSSRVSIISTKEGGALLKRLDGVPAAGWKGVERRLVTSEYDFSMDIYSDIKHNADTDYLSMGYWLVSYKDAATGKFTEGYTLGVAASGNNPYDNNNLAGLTGTATYEGPATGLYMTRQNAAAAAEFDYFNAKARLTAEFGDESLLGSIYGTISEGMTDGGAALPELTLGSADITDTFRGGNFRGDTSGMTDEGVALSGKWAGKFFGDIDAACTTAIPPSCPYPGSVAGTFGANAEDNLQSVLGAFGADVVTSDPMPDPNPMPMPDPMPGGGQPLLPFTLEPGSERQLTQEVFLVCPSSGLSCHIESITEDANGQFDIQLAEMSDTPFFWNSTTGLFAGGTLSPYEHRTVRLVGSQNTHVVTCGQAEPCDVSGLHVNEQGDFEWNGPDLVHVSADETGFFLKGDKKITYPDGTEVLFSCPDGCGIGSVFLNKEGQPSYTYDSERWQKPGANLVIGGGQLGSPVSPDPTPRTPPIDPSKYAGLPAALTKFSIDHFELSDLIYYLVDTSSNLVLDTVREETVCPGVGRRGIECKQGGKILTPGYVLGKIQERITATSPDLHGYRIVGIDHMKLRDVLSKLGSGQPLTPDEKELFDGFNIFASWGEHSAFGGMFIPNEKLQTPNLHWFAFGDLYDGKPMPIASETSATWRGSMTGQWFTYNATGREYITTVTKAGYVGGTSELVYDFATDTLDLTLMITHDSTSAGVGFVSPYPGERMIKWNDLRQNNDGSFFYRGNHKSGIHPDPKLGMVDGDFYGRNAKEVAGIFERYMGDYLVGGVFGGKRQ